MKHNQVAATKSNIKVNKKMTELSLECFREIIFQYAYHYYVIKFQFNEIVARQIELKEYS